MDLGYMRRREFVARPVAFDALIARVAAAQAASPTALAQLKITQMSATASERTTRDHFGETADAAPVGSFVTGLDGRQPN